MRKNEKKVAGSNKCNAHHLFMRFSLFLVHDGGCYNHTELPAIPSPYSNKNKMIKAENILKSIIDF